MRRPEKPRARQASIARQTGAIPPALIAIDWGTTSARAYLAPEGVADYLSGLLLGAETAAARNWLRRHALEGAAVTLLGDAQLCERHRRALAMAGVQCSLGPHDAAAGGLWRIARHAGMLAA